MRIRVDWHVLGENRLYMECDAGEYAKAVGTLEALMVEQELSTCVLVTKDGPELDLLVQAQTNVPKFALIRHEASNKASLVYRSRGWTAGPTAENGWQNE